MMKISSKSSPPPPRGKRMLTFDDLRAKGISFSRNYLRELWEQGRFPKPFHLSPRKLAWPEEIVDQWIEDRIKLANYKIGG
jgi:predicted DNA-binding transcriptional regulator AlpA